jgi:glycosidase
MEVDPSVGGEMALVSLIRAARERGIGLLIDGVFNHTGSDSKYFNKFSNYDTVGAYQSRLSPYFSWYNFYDFPDKYECWWEIDILPRIDPSIPSCREYFVGEGGVVEKYAKLGIDGMRLDVVDELPSDFVKDIKRVLFNNGATLLYGEVWEDASNKIAYGKRQSYYLGSELDGVMNYPLREGIIDYIRNGHTDKLMYALCEVYINAPKNVADMQMNLLGTHDTPRILTMLGGDEPYGYDNAQLRSKRMTIEQRSIAVARLKMAYTILATLPGIPAIFYGDDAGLEGYSDPFNRMPYPWGYEDGGIIEHYQKLGAIRRDNAAYARGEFKLLHMDSKHLIYARYLGNVAYLTVVNNSLCPLVVNFDMTHKTLIGDVGAFPPMSASIFKVSRQATIYI